MSEIETIHNPNHPKEPLFNDYQGPRWTYGLTYRPLDIASVPKGWIVGSLKDSNEYRHGTVDYPFPLTEAEEKSYELTPVGAPEDNDAWRQEMFVRELCDNIRNSIITNIREGRIPIHWDGIELRWLLRERAADAAVGGTWDRKSARFKTFENTVLVNNL